MSIQLACQRSSITTQQMVFCINGNKRSDISLTHSLDRLTGDGSLCPPYFTITGHVPSSICSEPDIDLELADHSRYVEDDLADASSPACHRVGDLHGCWLPDEVLHAQEPILADDVHVQISRYVCQFCCRCLPRRWVWLITDAFVTKSYQRIPRSHRRHHFSKASSFRVSDFVKVSVPYSRIVGQRRRERYTGAVQYTGLILTAAIQMSAADPWHLKQDRQNESWYQKWHAIFTPQPLCFWMAA